jgi:putative tryptophan/tyrosine transport system substrate-binding protein
MIRRDLIKLVVASLSAYPFAATAQRSIPIIGVLSPAVRPTKFSASIYGAFSQGMRELGYVEGKDYSIEWRFANGDYARLPELANELVELKVNVIFATSTPSILAVHKATTSIPIVMGFYEDDPTDYGLAATLAHPGGNVTGLAAMQVESLSKHLDLTRAMLPKLNRLGILINPNVGSHRTALLKLQDAAEKAGMRISDLEARTPQDIETAFSAMGQANKLDAIFMLGDALFFGIRQRIAELSLNHQLPLVAAGPREYALAGALVTYGASITDLFRRSATYVDKILKGAKPGDMPIEQPIKFDLVVNLKTAKALGVQIPDKMLAIADEVIE